MTVFRLLAVSAIALVAGCTVGPDYRKPPIAVSDRWLEPAAAGEVDTRWWASFGDATLMGLVDRALRSSPDLREAEARVAEARANRDAAAGGRLPQVEANGSATRNVISENGQLPVANIPGFDRSFSLYDIGFDASWEVDLWGRNRREVEAAAARGEAAEWSRRDVMVTLIAEVARNYIDFRHAQSREAIAVEELAANAELANLAALRFWAGEDTRQQADRAGADRATSQAALNQARSATAAAAYRIATLVGTSPEEIVSALRASTGPIPPPPAIIASGVRSDLLRRRPDIRRAERELAAASAEIGVATADLFPRFSLIGSLGQQARRPGDLLSSASTNLSIGPTFSWPIFSAGRIRAQIRGVDARASAAAARYEKAVVGALSDSESAANRLANAAAAADAAQEAFDEERRALRLSSLRFARGEDDRLTLERSRLRLAQAERRQKDALAAYSNAAVALNKSLGGGWDPMPDASE
ncbi:MAG: efflux transporter outer membrane subunit [Sphingosinicella sp.]|nr:efflux transporter outer membrane subunit [Sphingosinicella sp.]